MLSSQFPSSGSSQEPFVTIRQQSPESVKPPNLLDEDCVDLPQQQPIALPPPRPANPELLRLQKEVQEKFAAEFVSLTQAMAMDAERLRAQQADLLAGEPAIRDEMARLAAVKDVCLSVAGRMRIAVDNAERNMAELRRKGDPEVDELVCSTTIVHNQ
jgi:ESCRT-I complex subunit TSG101